MKKSQYINSEWHEGHAEAMKSYDSATHELLWKGNAADPQQCHHAVVAAQQAFTMWSNQPLSQRIELLHAYAQQLKNHKEDIALTISQEMGKPLPESQAEVAAMINKIAISIDAYYQRCKEQMQELPKANVMTRHKPHGVMVILGPFNFPGHLPNGHLVPALLAGNTVVLKPSEYTPLTAIKMMQCYEAAEFPAGVVNCVLGGKGVAQALLDEPIDGVLFTGSYAVGQAIHRHFAGRPEVLLALEMAGNNPLVVCDPSNQQNAIDCIIQSAFLTSGQRCTCARRLILLRHHNNQQLLEGLVKQTNTLRVGNYQQEPPVFMGPVISQQAAANILQRYNILLTKGAKPLLCMIQDKQNLALLRPGIVDMTLCTTYDDQEIFGPLLQVFWADDFRSAIDLANQTAYGLAAGCITDDPDQFQQFFNSVSAGVINWNCPLTGASSAAPFGGVGHSGNHRPSAFYAADYCAYPVASMLFAKI
jgi:succinylglutamic semialdehyde dehydrogenase